MLNRHRHAARQSRTGAAVVELAICIPAIVLLVMGAIECCTMIFTKQSLHVTAYEGVRVAIKPESNNGDVLSRCDRVLTERSIVNPQVALSPADIEDLPRGTAVEVRVSAPTNENNVLPLRFFTGDLVATATMIKE